MAAVVPVVAALAAAVAQVAAASEVADKYALKGFAICQHALKYSVTGVSYVVQVRPERAEAPSPGPSPWVIVVFMNTP